ncbi:Uncharacterized protein ABC855_g4147 [[Candida] zeylanoides]
MAWLHKPTASSTIGDVPSNIVSNLVARAKTSDACKKSHSSDCEKPVSQNGLTIGLAIGIPALVVVIVLGCLLLRNYRREKKEMMEHDPDFDENGEATALPDLPTAHQQKQYDLEDPFHNRNSMRYPVATYSKSDQPSTLSQGSHHPYMKGGDAYVDNIVLPYHHDTGSKHSLDEYARNISEYSAYGATPRASTFMNSKTRTSSFTNASMLGPYHNSATQLKGTSVSPQKSRNFVELAKDPTQSPTKSSKGTATTTKGGQEFSAVPNESTTSFGQQAQFFNAKDSFHHSTSDLESVSDSDNEGSADASGADQFAINYENESGLKINDFAPSASVDTSSSHASFDTTRERPESTTFEESTEVHDDSHTANELSFVQGMHGDDATGTHKNLSPFGDSDDHKASNDDKFEFSHDSSNTDTATTSLNAHLEAPIAVDEFETKSPRISDFNLLKNDSDDEDGEERELTVEQEEELQRMKSVYKVYFDREKSIKSNNGKADGHAFSADASQPLPAIPQNKDFLMINKELKTDTDYDKRQTTTSSIYTEAPLFSQDEQQYVHQQQMLAQEAPQQYHYQQQDQAPPLIHQPVELPPLQQLPPASDIRKSTIQTYTDFQPRPKNSSAMSPPINKQPFVPIENDGVWTAPISSPLMGSQGSFNNDVRSVHSPQLTHTPSATQLSRSSVVMLNPVTEITKQRKFRPAGSHAAPNGSATSLTNQSLRDQQYINMHPQQQQQQQQPLQQYQQQPPHQVHVNGLIPDGKDDVRRMMNSNF